MIPREYRKLWKPYRPHEGKVLYHLTTEVNLRNILKMGYLEPRDPAPRNWAGMKAIFMADPDDPKYEASLKNVFAHVKKKHKKITRLHIKPLGRLYKSIDPSRTFQVISLRPIPVENILEIEKVGL